MKFLSLVSYKQSGSKQDQSDKISSKLVTRIMPSFRWNLYWCFLQWHLHYFVTAQAPHEVFLLSSPPAPLFFAANKLPTHMRNFCCSACLCTLCFSHLFDHSSRWGRSLFIHLPLSTLTVFSMCHQSTSKADSYFYVIINHENTK